MPRRLPIDEARLRPHLGADRERGELPASAALGERARGRGRAGTSSSAGAGRGAVGWGAPRPAGGRQRAGCDRRHEPGRGGDREGTSAAVSSRLVRSAGGRPVAVEITTPLPYLEVGYRYRVLGDEIRLSGAFGFTGEPTGRPPLPDEAATVHRHVGRVERTARTWTDAHREEARRLQPRGCRGLRSPSESAATSGTSRRCRRGFVLLPERAIAGGSTGGSTVRAFPARLATADSRSHAGSA
jgi:hypothetical protein